MESAGARLLCGAISQDASSDARASSSPSKKSARIETPARRESASGKAGRRLQQGQLVKLKTELEANVHPAASAALSVRSFGPLNRPLLWKSLVS